MTKIENEQQYNAILKRVEHLMLTLPEDTPEDDVQMTELTILGNMVADYEEEHYPIEPPSVIDVIKLRMFEMGLTQMSLSKLLGISASRISELLSGKKEPTLKQAREISRKLNIAPSIVLGV